MEISLKRVLWAGLAAGVVVALAGAGLVPIVGDDMAAAMARFQLAPMGPAAMAYFAAVSLLNGLAVVALHAVLLPLLKSWVQAALVAAGALWLFGYTLPNFANVAYGFMPMKLTIIGTLWGVLELGAGSLIGARLYRGSRPAPRA